jgi:hypothetical protein
MLGMHARVASVFVGCSLGAAAAFAGCGFQTSGLGSGGAPGATTLTHASSTAGTTTSHATGTGGGTSASTGTGAREDAGSTDASIDAAPVVDAAPTAYTSCLDWLQASPGAASGVYDLLDDAQNVYQAYCEMEADSGDGGGWTLVLKIDGTKTTFPYGDAHWTNSVSYNPDMPYLDTNEAKLASFWSVPFTAMRVGMIDAAATRWLLLPLGGSSVLDLVTDGDGGDGTDGGALTTYLSVDAWEGLLASGSIQTNCNWQGINADGHVRIGLVGDDSNPQCNSPDSFIGFGADGSFQAPSFDCGNIAHYNPDHNDRTTMTFGYVMVR